MGAEPDTMCDMAARAAKGIGYGGCSTVEAAKGIPSNHVVDSSMDREGAFVQRRIWCFRADPGSSLAGQCWQRGDLCHFSAACHDIVARR